MLEPTHHATTNAAGPTTPPRAAHRTAARADCRAGRPTSYTTLRLPAGSPRDQGPEQRDRELSALDRHPTPPGAPTRLRRSDRAALPSRGRTRRGALDPPRAAAGTARPGRSSRRNAGGSAPAAPRACPAG